MSKRRQNKTFKPPTEAQRLKALGKTDQLNEDFRRALTIGIDQNFTPMSEPEEGDWLSQHDEEGQTAQQFEKLSNISVKSTRNIIYMQPFGNFNNPRSPSLQIICEFSRLFFPGCQTELLPPVDLNDNMKQRINEYTQKPQYLIGDFTEIMKKMQQKRNNRQELFTIGVTMVDIYPDSKWNFVYGEASPEDGIALFSFARFDPLFFDNSTELSQQSCTDQERKLILRRAVGTYLHEVMHLFEIEHCIYYLCLMNGCNGGAELDKQPLYLCPICVRKMSIVFQNQNYDIMHMYNEVYELLNKLGLQEEGNWYKNRLQILNNDAQE